MLIIDIVICTSEQHCSYSPNRVLFLTINSNIKLVDGNTILTTFAEAAAGTVFQMYNWLLELPAAMGGQTEADWRQNSDLSGGCCT